MAAPYRTEIFDFPDGTRELHKETVNVEVLKIEVPLLSRPRLVQDAPGRLRTDYEFDQHAARYLVRFADDREAWVPFREVFKVV